MSYFVTLHSVVAKRANKAHVIVAGQRKSVHRQSKQRSQLVYCRSEHLESLKFVSTQQLGTRSFGRLVENVTFKRDPSVSVQAKVLLAMCAL